jgi:hypothetical protein
MEKHSAAYAAEMTKKSINSLVAGRQYRHLNLNSPLLAARDEFK